MSSRRRISNKPTRSMQFCKLRNKMKRSWHFLLPENRNYVKLSTMISNDLEKMGLIFPDLSKTFLYDVSQVSSPPTSGHTRHDCTIFKMAKTAPEHLLVLTWGRPSILFNWTQGWKSCKHWDFTFSCKGI